MGDHLRKRLIISIIALLAFAVPSVASADYFQTKSNAQRLVRKDIGKRYGEYGASVHCTPFSGDYDPTYKYHVYNSYWNNAACGGGEIRITGRKDFSGRWDAYTTGVLAEPDCYE